jgi:ATP-binding cassette subfamily C protein CydD
MTATDSMTAARPVAAASQTRKSSEAEETRRWLKAAAVSGRGQLRAAAACRVLETVFAIVQWVGLAWVAQGVLAHPTLPGWPALALLVGGGLLAATVGWGGGRFAAAGRRQISGAIRQRLLAALLPSGQRGDQADSAAAGVAAVERADNVADYHAQALPLRLSAPVSMVIVFAVTAAVQWPAALVLLVGSVIVPPNMRLAGLFAAEGTDEQMAASGRLAAVVLDSFRGMRTLRGIGALDRRREELADAAGQLDAATMTVVRKAFLSGAVMDVVITFAIAVDATYIGLSLLGYVNVGAAAPRLTLFSGLLALLLCPMYFGPLRATAAAYHTRERAVAAVPSIIGLFADTEEAQETNDRMAPAVAGPVTVLLDDVAFRFPGSDRAVLSGAALMARAGHWTAVTGPSGAGKTTLLSLIAGTRRPDSGSVRWSGTAKSTPPHLGGCAWIGQQTVILPGTIGDNIRIGRPDAGIGAVDHAVAAAGLADVVARLPQGLNTQLGEGGWGLSTGEARRISIARAFLRDTDLWLLDEPTAHLDPDAEEQVVGALRAATSGRTVIVATHSAALARSADAVLSIADGTITCVREEIPA